MPLNTCAELLVALGTPEAADCLAELDSHVASSVQKTSFLLRASQPERPDVTLSQTSATLYSEIPDSDKPLYLWANDLVLRLASHLDQRVPLAAVETFPLSRTGPTVAAWADVIMKARRGKVVPGVVLIGPDDLTENLMPLIDGHVKITRQQAVKQLAMALKQRFNLELIESSDTRLEPKTAMLLGSPLAYAAGLTVTTTRPATPRVLAHRLVARLSAIHADHRKITL